MIKSKAFNASLRQAAKGSGWSVKKDTLAHKVNNWVLFTRPSRLNTDSIEFHAKPIIWDQLLWSILQIEGNNTKPASFHYWGAFVCPTPALVQCKINNNSNIENCAKQFVEFAIHSQAEDSLWKNYDLNSAIENETPNITYRYHMTRVIERIVANDRPAAVQICKDAKAGLLDLHSVYYGTDLLSPASYKPTKAGLSFLNRLSAIIRRKKISSR